MTTKKKKGLGRGLNALLGEKTAASISELTQEVKQHDQLKNIAVEKIVRGKYQPRHDIESQALEELAASIKQHGIIQPIVVRPINQNEYEIIAGERRWRASQLAGLDSVPAIVRDVADEATVAMALIENIQREDLNAIEEAMALHRLKTEFDMTHEQVAEAVGKSRATVTNLLRLLNLTEVVRRYVEHGDLELGHAKVLLALSSAQQEEAAGLIINKGLSVRQTEVLVKQMQTDKSAKKIAATIAKRSPDIVNLEEMLAEKVGVPVIIQHHPKGKGKLVFNYSSLDELDGILQHIK